MGADGELIRAAGRMGPKPWDYSGIMNAIAAFGKLAIGKKKIADELTTYGEKEFEIKEMPDEMLTGPFGDDNSSFFSNIKNQWLKHVETIEKPLNLPSGKKYKNAVKSINMLKGVLEKNKADLLIWAEVRKNVNENWANASNGIGRQVFHRVADLQINNTHGDMNAASRFTADGLKIYSSDVDLMQNREFSPSELMEGFFVNQMSINDNSGKLTDIIDKFGAKRKNAGKNWDENLAKTEIVGFINTMKESKYGGNGLKSLAFDYYNAAGGGTFVQANKSLFSNPGKNNEEANLSYVEQYKKANPDATPGEIELAYTHQAVDVWDGGDSSEFEVKLTDWLLGISKASYDGAKSKKQLSTEKKDKQGLGPKTFYVTQEQIGGKNGIIDRIKAGQEFPLGVLNHKKIDGKWAVNQKFGGTKKAGGGYYFIKDGTDADLHSYLRIINDPRFDFLLN